MSSIMELYNAYNDDLWKIYANSFKEVSEKIGDLDKIPQDILNVLVGLLGLEEANVWIKTEIKGLDNNIILDLIKTEVGIKALKMFLLSMPI